LATKLVFSIRNNSLDRTMDRIPQDALVSVSDRYLPNRNYVNETGVEWIIGYVILSSYVVRYNVWQGCTTGKMITSRSAYGCWLTISKRLYSYVRSQLAQLWNTHFSLSLSLSLSPIESMHICSIPSTSRESYCLLSCKFLASPQDLTLDDTK